MEETIKENDYVIFQRQSYTKLHKLMKLKNLKMGGYVIQTGNLIGAKYFDTFQIKNVPDTKRLYTLEKVDDPSIIDTNVTVEQSGNDNRNIEADDNNQIMSSEEINRLKDEELSSNNIVEKLISNSKTFSEKTEFSQEKYIRKKHKKYFEFMEVRPPNLRLIAQMFYRQDPAKTLGIRYDDLSQIMSYANIRSDGTYILYDSGTSGLMSAAVMDTIGSGSVGRLIHMHPGNECQKVAFLALTFPEEQSRRCIDVNLYSVLRHYYQGKNKRKVKSEDTEMIDITKIKQEPDAEGSVEPDAAGLVEPDAKRRKVEQPMWQLENEEACALMKQGVHSIVIVAKEHPVNIVKALECFLLPSRNLVVFSPTKEPLQDLYFHLKSKNYLDICIRNNFMRYYQILPERTHPQVNMSNDGFLLTAVKIK